MNCAEELFRLRRAFAWLFGSPDSGATGAQVERLLMHTDNTDEALAMIEKFIADENGEIPPGTFQQRVAPWMQECFGPEISGDQRERNHRFLEEALELVQSCEATRTECHQLVDYVFDRHTGEKVQEVGGVMVTLAALCLAQGIDMHVSGHANRVPDGVPGRWSMMSTHDRFGRRYCHTPEDAISLAITASLRSPCLSKRGVVIWRAGILMASAANHQPAGFVCDGTGRCKEKCGKSAVHAEQAAMLDALKAGYDLTGAHMLHVKTESGQAVASMAPSCIECSKLICEVGIEDVWLLHAPESQFAKTDRGWDYGVIQVPEGVLVRREARELHRATAEDWHKIQIVPELNGGSR